MKERKPWYALIAMGGVAAGVGAVLLLSQGARAGKGGALDDGRDLLPQAGISLQQAIAAAQTAADGPLDEVDLEYYDGRLVFNVDVGDADVKVDAETGDVLAAESEEALED